MRSGLRFLLLWSVGGVVAGCGSHAALDAEVASRVEVRVARVQSGARGGTIEASGEWKAAVETVVPAPFDAVVESISLRPGDPVRKGATLAWCRTLESDATLRGAELMAQQAGEPQGQRDAKQALAEARASIVRVPIPSPANGTVLRRQAEPGSRVSSGSELLALVADGALVFEARLPSADAAVLRVGQRGSISDGDGPARAATVWTFPPASAGDQTTLLWLRPAVPPRRPALGRFGTVSFSISGSLASLTVPDSAVVEDDLTGVHRIAVVDSGAVVRWVEVRLGPHEGPLRVVSGAGVASGTVVVVDGQRALTEGSRVVVVP